MYRNIFYGLFIFLFLPASGYAASETLPETSSQVIVRDHPRTGRPYVVITDGVQKMNPFEKLPVLTRTRPDYAMLDPKIKRGKVPYQGPVSDRKKVYVFAATIATLGAAGGTAIIAAAPAATGVGSSAGAGAYALAGTGVASGTVSTAWLKTRPDPDKDKIEHGFESHEIQSADNDAKKD